MSPETRSFDVSAVPRTTEALPALLSQDALQGLLGSYEACYRGTPRLLEHVASHPLIATLHGAYSTHAPLCLSPDIVWLTLAQGFAAHVNGNVEALRSRIVAHDGKVKIEIVRNDFVKGAPDNPWPEVFTDFARAVRHHVGDIHELVVGDFSTTGPTERAAFEVVLLDALQGYFGYEMSTICGIPTITLEGTQEDWRAVVHRARRLEAFGLDWWIAGLLPVLEQFVDASAGRVDREFWDSIYKWKGPDGSGSPVVSGWILKLFPYLWDHHGKFARNPWLDKEPSRHHGPDRSAFPCRLSRVPFKWTCYGTSYAMEFLSGFVGVAQDDQTLALRPEIGWAVREAGADGSGRALEFEGPHGEVREFL